MTRAAALALALIPLACAHERSGGGGDTPDQGVAGCAGCTGRCFDDQCISDNGTCATDDDCENDTWCESGVCVPWGPPRGPFDPDCKGEAFSPGDFKPPVEKCHWLNKNGDSKVYMTPLVLDLNQDGKPEILFVNGAGHLIAIRGADCGDVFDRDVGLGQGDQIAAADLDGDGLPEIVGITAGFAGMGGFGSQAVVFDHAGNKLAGGSLGIAGSAPCSGPAIANVDGKGPPEILIDGTVMRYVKGNPSLQVLFSKDAVPAGWGNVSLFADLDGDGRPEAVTGLRVYDGVTGADETPSSLKNLGTMPGAYPAVADFNGDGKPDLVNVQSASGMQQLTVVDVAADQVIFGPYTVAGGGWGGTPTIGDYDGDGVPDIGFASASQYYVYALKCAKDPKPADCTGSDPGVLWQRATHDQSSGGTGSSTFDFNGDGVEEVVYRDECWLRVYNGKDGKTVFAQVISSGTCLEYPVIADVDGDGHADIVVPSDDVQGAGNCANVAEGQTGQQWTAPTRGVYVLTDPMNRWMPSRALWTSHSYHITEINDDLSVPASEMPSWQVYNDYRKNIESGFGMPGGKSDYTGAPTTSVDNGGSDCKVSERLWAEICNRGAGAAAPGVPGTFYTGDPRQAGAAAICTAYTTSTLQPGDCEAVACDWTTPPGGPASIWFRADDDGHANARTECKNGNDLLYLPMYTCPGIG